ncbi:AraC family transcriptional regulator [Vallitaleaceae bacterium 9-2]
MHNREINPYQKPINQVQDYIEEHLSQTLTIKELANIAHFSEYHFQRIFSGIVGESLYSFIKRLRLEKAAYMLLADRTQSINNIAARVGFEHQASFAKAFQGKYGMSGSAYRKKYSRLCPSPMILHTSQKLEMRIEPIDTYVKEEAAMKLIYIRNTGVYKGDSALFSELFYQLYQWAKARDLISKRTRWFVLYHDFGQETEEEYLRLSVCMSVEQALEVSGNIGQLNLPMGKYGVGRFCVGPDEYEEAWNYMYMQWLPESGYRLDHRFALEHYPHSEEKNSKRTVEIYLSIISS